VHDDCIPVIGCVSGRLSWGLASDGMLLSTASPSVLLWFLIVSTLRLFCLLARIYVCYRPSERIYLLLLEGWCP